MIRIRHWPLRRDDSSRVLIGAVGTWRSDWRRWDVSALVGVCNIVNAANFEGKITGIKNVTVVHTQ